MIKFKVRRGQPGLYGLTRALRGAGYTVDRFDPEVPEKTDRGVCNVVVVTVGRGRNRDAEGSRAIISAHGLLKLLG